MCCILQKQTNEKQTNDMTHGEDGANSQADVLSPHSTGNDSTL